MWEQDKHLEQFRDLTWFIALLRHDFEHVAHDRGYTDDQFRILEHGLNQLEPVPDELYKCPLWGISLENITKFRKQRPTWWNPAELLELLLIIERGRRFLSDSSIKMS